jgi:flavodoxin
MKTCIVYYSKVGNTEIAAKYLAEKLGANIIKLEDKTNYKGLLGFIKGGMNASKVKMAELDHSVYDEMARYDRIVLATPVWAGKTTPAMNAILENVDFTGKEVYVMTTQAMPAAKDTEERVKFYREKVEKKKGKFVTCFSLQGSAPGKPRRSKEDLVRQVDELVNIE